jgi:tetratricopeptide (TPR) repeat protein
VARKLNKDQIFKAADKYIRDGKVEKAITEYENWLSANPKDWNTIRQIGDLYHRIGRNAEAIKKYSQIAQYYKTDGFNVRAIATYKMILRLDPQNEGAMASLAELQVDQGLLMEAKAQYQTLVELYNKSGQKKRAAEVFKKLAEIDPSDLKVRYKYAEFLDRQGQTGQAIAEYVGIADEFINKGLVSEAIQIMEKGLRIDSANRGLRCKLAQASILQGDYAKAIQILSEIRGRYADDIELLTRLGEAYMGAGNADEADSVFNHLAELEPENPEHTSRRAEVAIGQGRYDQALEFLIPIVDRYVDSSEGDKAVALLQKVLGRDPHHVETLVKLSDIHTILRNDQARISAYDQLCEAYSHHGDFEKAVHVAEQLIELEPENSQHKDRLRFLKSRRAPSSVAPDGDAAPAPPVSTPSSPPPPELDVDIPRLESVDVTDDLLKPEPVEPPVEDQAVLPVSEAPAVDEFEGPITFSSEDEEHIKEKLTEAEVFVRYGLVDKAVDQLKDVLESFRFHVESREKLIEIYKDQGMNREAAEQVAELARVHERRGESDRAEQLLHEARELNPALEEAEAKAGVSTEEELELTLIPEEELNGVGLGAVLVAPEGSGLDDEIPVLEAEAPEDLTVDEELPVEVDDESFAESSPPILTEQEEEVELALEESGEVPVATDLDRGDTAASELHAPEALSDISIEEEIPVVEEDELAEVADLTFDGEAEAPEILDDVGIDAAVEDVSEIDLQLPSTESPAVEQESLVGDVPGEGDEFHVELDEGAESLPVEDGGGEISFDIPDAEFDAPDPDESVVDMELPDAPPPSEPVIDLDLPDAAPPSDPLIDMELPDAVPPSDPLIDMELPETAPPSEPPIDLELPGDTPTPEPLSAEAAPATGDVVESAGDTVSTELQEVDEYIALGLYEDARDTLRELLKRSPGNPSVRGKIEELGFSVSQLQKEATAPPAEAEVAEVSLPSEAPLEIPPPGESPGEFDALVQEEPLASIEGFGEPEAVEPDVHAGADSASASFVDLASELSQEMFGTQSAVGDERAAEGSVEALSDPGLDEIFREFKKGVEKQLGTEDYDTRYNLGIAYKEMGLLDEAIAEFQLAAKDDARLLECCSMLGLCFMEKGMPEIAVKWFEKGLDAPDRSEEEYHGLRYDLAQAHETVGNTGRALELYMDIYRVNARFRDVRDRVRELQEANK